MMTAANIFLSRLCRLAARHGMDTDALLSSAGIDPAVIDAQETRVDADKLAVVVERIWNYTQDETMGLSEHPIPRGAFHMMGKVAIQEPNLGRALQVAVRFFDMVTRAFQLSLETDGDRATLKFVMHSPQLDEDRLFAEINLMAWHRFASWLIEESINLDEIFFNYPVPVQIKEYAYLFPGQHSFNAGFLGFSFRKQFLEREVSQTPVTLESFMRRGPIEYFVQPKTDFSLTHELKRLLSKRLREGLPVVEEVAALLHMTSRTLIRRLDEEGTSYQQIKDLVRRDRAVDLLTRHTMPLSEVSSAVGFSDPAVFARAFKHWTGVTPRDYRASALQSTSSGQWLVREVRKAR